MALSVNIEKKLGSFHLKVDFAVENEVVSLLGASGCGKSMTLKCIAGIEKPDRGRIVLNDHVLYDSEEHINLKPQQRRVGYLFQQYALFPNMSVYNNIACGIRKDRGLSGSEKKSIILDMMEKVGLSGMESKLPSQLSGGQQQRVALARILVNEPDALLLDEPFSALDSHLRLQMEKEVADLVSEYGHPVLFVSHDRDEVYRLSDKIAIMDNGSFTSFGEKTDVFKDPGSVRGAVLTGISNISEVDIIDGNTVFAKRYGVNITVDGLKEGTTSIGIPDVHIYYGPKLAELEKLEGPLANIFEAEVIDQIDNPSSFTTLLTLNGNKKDFLILDIPKAEWRNLPHDKIKIHFIPGGIRCLK